MQQRALPAAEKAQPVGPRIEQADECGHEAIVSERLDQTVVGLPERGLEIRYE